MPTQANMNDATELPPEATGTPEGEETGQPARTSRADRARAERAAKPAVEGAVNVQAPPGAQVRTRVIQDVTTVQPTPKAPIAGAPAQAPKAGGRITELAEWLYYWSKYESDGKPFADVTQFQMFVLREQDPPPMPGQKQRFARPALTSESLGKWPFPTDVQTFIGYLQSINGDSGGNFRVTLWDADGDPIATEWPDENGFWRGTIPDPLGTAAARNTAPEQPANELDALKNRMFERLLEKALEEKPKETNIADTLTTGVLPVVTSLFTLSQSVLNQSIEAAQKNIGGGNATESTSVAGRFVDGLMNSEKLQDKFVGLAERGFDAVGGLVSRVATRRNGNTNNGTAEQPASPTQQQIEDAKQTVNIMEYVLTACEKNEPIDVPTDPVFLQYKEQAPEDYAKLIGALKIYGVDTIIQGVVADCDKAGLGERARAAMALDTTRGFVQYLQQSVKK
jgi:hypothetical protein